MRLAEWGEIGQVEGTWMAPAMRMKKRRQHWVPPSGRAMQVIQEARTFGSGSLLVFGDGGQSSTNGFADKRTYNNCVCL